MLKKAVFCISDTCQKDGPSYKLSKYGGHVSSLFMSVSGVYLWEVLKDVFPGIDFSCTDTQNTQPCCHT